jgi:hypothetical protein
MRTVAVVALVVLVAGCSDDDEDGGDTTATPSTAVAHTSAPSTTTSPATTPETTVVDDTDAVGGTALYAVDLGTGAAQPLGRVGTEVGVLGLTTDADGTLIAVTDAAELVTFTVDDPTTIATRVPITGVEGSTLLALDRRADDGALLALGDAGVLVHVERTTGAATPVGVEIPFTDPGIGLDIDLAASALVVTDAGGAHRQVGLASGAVADLPPFAGAAPRIVAVAVADDGTRYGIDSAAASLVTLGADGAVTTVGALGIGVTDGASLDIGPDGRALLASPG